jgi:hypothetical protein
VTNQRELHRHRCGSDRPQGLNKNQSCQRLHPRVPSRSIQFYIFIKELRGNQRCLPRFDGIADLVGSTAMEILVCIAEIVDFIFHADSFRDRTPRTTQVSFFGFSKVSNARRARTDVS